MTQTIYDEFLKLNISKNKISIIPNGINIKDFKKNNRYNLRAKYNLNKNDFIYICVSRNHPKKGIIYLVEAFNKINRDNFKLILYGKDINKIDTKNKNIIKFDEKDISNQSQAYKEIMQSKVINELYNLSDVFVLPTLIESFGIVLIEAMASQIPIISTNTPGVRDVLDNGKYGILVKPNSANELYLQMINIYENENLRIKMVEETNKIINSFDIENITKKYISLYQRLISSDEKILIVISELSLGGTEKQLKNIISELCNEELFEFNVVTLISKGNYYSEFKKIKNLKVNNLFNLKNKNFIIKYFFALLSIISLTRFIIKKQPDIIHFYLPTSYLIGASTIFFL